MSTAAIVGGTAAAGLAGSAISANAAGNAASSQVSAANNAAALQAQEANNSLNFSKLQYGNSLNLLSPFYNTGVSANSRLAYLMGLNPAQGLPAGVMNPNAPQGGTTQPAGVNPLAGTGPNGTNGQAVLPTTAGSRPGFGAIAEGGTAPIAANFNRLSAVAPQGGTIQQPGTTDPTANPGVGPGAIQQPGQTDTPSGNPAFQSPTGITGGPVMAGSGTLTTGAPGQTQSTNVGGTAQVPMVNGGGTAPGAPSATGTAAPGGFGSLAQGWNQTFSSPTAVTEQNDPGYQFRLQQGQTALQNSAAARGGLLTGGTAKALDDFTQNDASNEYNNVYNRSLQNYNTNYNTFTNDQTNEFNRLSALSGTGQVSANNLSSAGLATAGQVAGINANAGQQIGQNINNAGAANASGYVGGANAISSGINGLGSSLSTLALLQSLQNGGAASNPLAGNGVI